MPVHYVGKRKDPQQLLFRETTQWTSSPQHTFIKDSVSAMLATPALDPDDTSYWPAGTTSSPSMVFFLISSAHSGRSLKGISVDSAGKFSAGMLVAYSLWRV